MSYRSGGVKHSLCTEDYKRVHGTQTIPTPSRTEHSRCDHKCFLPTMEKLDSLTPTGVLHFTELHLTVLCRYRTFINMEARPAASKQITAHGRLR